MHVQVKITSASVDQTELSMVVQSCFISDSHDVPRKALEFVAAGIGA